MSKKEYLFLYLISTIFYSVITLIIRVPGYMDAEYYYAGGIQIVKGFGGWEPFAWNYLTQPVSLPIPSFSYWMPFTSLISAAGMFIIGSTGFYAARLLFVLAAGLIPVLSARFAQSFLPGKQSGWFAGFTALFSIFFLPYFTVTDSFTPCMILGGCYLFVMDDLVKIWKKGVGRWKLKGILLGLVCGCLHLTRADGFVWLLIAIGYFSWFGLVNNQKFSRINAFWILMMILAGYLLPTSAWYIRNLTQYGSLFPPGNGTLLWSTGYNDLFLYRTENLTFTSLANLGLGKILADRASALWVNIQSLVSVNGGVIFLPFMALGWWNIRRSLVGKIGLLILIVNLFVMSILFPYAGPRGGFFHSNSTTQVLLWGLVPLGMEGAIQYGIKRWNWQHNRAWKMFGSIFLLSASFLSLIIFLQKYYGKSAEDILWNETLAQYEQIDAAIVSKTGDTDSIAMVNNPPGYYLATNRPGIVNPSDGLWAVLSAAEQFGVRFVVIDNNNVKILADLYGKNLNETNLQFLTEINGSTIYEYKKK